MNTLPPVAALCEIDDCGVLAVGRCRICRRAFCVTHQARESGYSAYVDWCSACFLQKQTDQQRLEESQRQAERDAKEFFASGQAQAILLSAGQQAVPIVARYMERKAGVLGTFVRFVDAHIDWTGWIIGEFTFSFTVWSEGQGSSSNYGTKAQKALAAVLCPGQDFGPYRDGMPADGLICVKPGKKNYEFEHATFYDWVGAAAAVMHLTGTALDEKAKPAPSS